MRIQQSSRQGCVVLTLAGRLDLPAAAKLQRAILKHLAEQPPAIICDLGQVEEIDPLCAAVFTSIRHPALDPPGTALLLCGARPAVSGILRRLRTASRVALYPSLDQALAEVGGRPPWPWEHLALEPVAAAARAGREFVREVCGRWGLEELADPAALLASELVALAVRHARTALELQVELRGSQLRVAVKDQDPAGGRTAWGTLALPVQEVEGPDRGPAEAAGPAGFELVWSKLRPPTLRAGLVPRAALLSLLQKSLEARLCLLDAPTGFGKTTLLGQWRTAAGGGRVAWLTVDEDDNDPARLWAYVVQALRTVEPEVGTAALEALRRPSPDLDRVVLPSLINDLHAVGSRLFLVLDDYHLVTNPACHQTLGFFLDHLPAVVHVALSARADPPLALARMRARGELVELRVADLRFTSEEASALLNASMGLRLAAGDVERLTERTEGWAAGLVLAGLSIRDRRNPHAFIASFQGDDRHVADYLGAEVLDRQPEEIRSFLLRTSVLERLSGPLCDAVLAAEGSTGLLVELERSNLFLVPLDDHRQWYRYHHLFRELLRLELGQREPELVPVLHRRAAAWHGTAGHLDESIQHACAAGDFAEAGALVARHWATYWLGGRQATVAGWLEGLPEEAITASPPVAFVAAWIRGFGGASKQDTERWLAAAEDDSDAGPPPDGIPSLALGAALARATMVFDDVGRSVAAGQRALELAGPEPTPFSWTAQAALGHGLYLAGRPAEARPRLEDLITRVPAADQPYAVATALAVLSLIAADQDDGAAASLARRAMAVVDAQELSFEPLSGIVHLALGRALERQGELAEAEVELGRALELLGIDSMGVHHTAALLVLASAQSGRGDLAGARVLIEQARELVERSADPGMLRSLLERVEAAPGSRARRRVQTAAPLTERELAVLRVLPTRLSTREIGRELSVSVTTVRSHVQAIYRKLGVPSRAEAVAQARQLHLLP